MNEEWSPRQGAHEEEDDAAAKYLARIGAGDATLVLRGWRARGYEIIFKSDTRAGKAFDVWLILAILFSVAEVMLASVQSIKAEYAAQLILCEWGFTLMFSIEYLLRLLCSPRPKRYASGFWGLLDLFSLVPTYLNSIFPGARVLVVIRTVRILRLFQVLRLGRYVAELNALNLALQRAARKILVFLYVVCTLVLILGAIMYLVEDDAGGFTSIPRSVYWAIVTMTTVGYGDISPVTPIGQAIAAMVMLLGYSMIVIPTGLVSAEFLRADRRWSPGTALGNARVLCSGCAVGAHARDARFCRCCATELVPAQPGPPSATASGPQPS